jgi:hypothetical protein
MGFGQGFGKRRAKPARGAGDEGKLGHGRGVEGIAAKVKRTR